MKEQNLSSFGTNINVFNITGTLFWSTNVIFDSAKQDALGPATHAWLYSVFVSLKAFLNVVNDVIVKANIKISIYVVFKYIWHMY